MLYFIKKKHSIDKKEKRKKNGLYFIQNYLQSKDKHSKSIKKDASKSELWKEQTGWRLGNAFSNKEKKKRNRFLFKTLH